ncbi:XRE family transcriptional regulator (plasmid) [Pseudomonas antarctica]|uniref:XRE family transcriptional regulator n=1 Tax=Pseudomonas antarctica TaxID=219572 RepID=A0A172ZAA9_9PSED|nr:transcriptional regulator [Pseudomonas antarctica]ANF89211.1 XRE family transcriptional regulator [Pseudomonas antarctica]
MITVLENSQTVRAALVDLQMLLEQLSGQFVNGINDAADYARASVLLDELTDGHDLNKYEEQILVELEDAILAYERDGEQFKAFNESFTATTSPVQLLKDLIETQQLTGSDLPEIGDKAAVSKVLNGRLAISHRMAFALAERFSMDPKAFAPTSAKSNVDTALATSRLNTPLPASRPGLKLHSGNVQVKPSVPAKPAKPSARPAPAGNWQLNRQDDEHRLVARAPKPSDRGPKP